MAKTPVSESHRERIFWWVLVAAFGILQLRADWHAANADAVSYLDLASRFREGHLDASAVAYWSPVYPALLAVMQVLSGASGLDPFGLAHLTNFVIWLIAFASFRWFVRELQNLPEGDGTALVRSALFRAVAYSVFLWSGLRLIGLGLITPDLSVAAAAYCISATVVRFETSARGNSRDAALLGVLLGFGYWIKAVLFPLGLVLLAAMFARRLAARASLRGVAVALVTFLLLASPLILLISREEGKLTFSGVARLNWAWYVGPAPMLIHWSGSPATGTAVHPTRQIHDDPDAYEFAKPFEAATYAPWYAPPYWHRGLIVEFGLDDQLRAFNRTAAEYAKIAASSMPELIALVMFAALALRWRRILWPVPILLLWSLAAILLYALVHVEDRFVAPFITVSAVGLFVWMRVPRESGTWRLMVVAARLLIVLLLGRTLMVTLVEARWPSSTLLRHREVASALQRAGIQPGDAVGSIGNSFDCYWAVIAGVRIVAEIPQADEEEFLTAGPEVRARVYERFSVSGARAIVSSTSSPRAEPGWTRVPTAGYAIRVLKPAER